MPYRHRLQASRFELKYLVDENLARNICDFASSHVERDEHADPGQPRQAYLVSSLYLDTPALSLYGQTIGGLRNRFKLRIRFYDNAPSSPAFLEIKWRENDVIRKQRAAVTREGARRLLEGQTPDASHLFPGEDGLAAESLHRFCELHRSIGAEGVLYVSYFREAYVSPASDQWRLTFDRRLRGGVFEPSEGLALPRKQTEPILDGVVLELKFTDRFPPWMRDLTRTFDLQRRSVAKYCHCVDAMGYRPHQWRFARSEIA